MRKAGKTRIYFVFLGFLTLAGLTGLATWSYLTRPMLTSVERGRRLAEQVGCFGCHGAEGKGGIFNPNRTDVVVPGWGSELMMFAHDTGQIREWIRDGISKARSQSLEWQDERDRGVMDMPAFGKKLTVTEIGELVSLVNAVNGGLAPADSIPRHGYFRADSLGCFGCHGPGGTYARPNPGSFKGYIPSWAGGDYPEVVTSRQEFDEWVNQGISKRFDSNRFARFFLSRASLKMPPYHSHLKPGDLDALWAYITWLRRDSPAAH
jgi:mono/diheme cytochrome c family protein